MIRKIGASMALMFLVSCSSTTTNTTTTTTPETTSGGATTATPAADADASAATAADASAAPQVAWADMTPQQKGEFMQQRVMPEMRTMFQTFDAHRFEHFTCATCHGANAREVNFHMPNGIAPLDPTQIPGMFASQDPMHVFMTQRVWPRMTELLGAQRYNPETHQGFGCLGCHGMRTPAAAAPATPTTPAAPAHPATPARPGRTPARTPAHPPAAH